MQIVESNDSRTLVLKQRFGVTRSRTLELCAPLETEDFVPQPIEDVSPPKWNIAHTTWFFEEMVLKNFVSGYKVFDPSFGFLFNSYYNSIGDRTARNQRGNLSRPLVKQVFSYRKYIEEQMNMFFDSAPDKEALDLIELGINHEQQHQELFLTDLKYTFSLNPLDVVYRDDFALVERAPDSAREFADVPEGVYEIGHTGNGFCFDNELRRHKNYLSEFQINKHLVTNAEFIAFINDGGYSKPALWHSEGWDWVQSNNICSPLYWRLGNNGSYENYTLAGMRSVRHDKPVCHISFYEASAFAEWSGYRLPTEFEWEAAHELFSWGSRWEWTSSSYEPYPGFSIAEGAVGEYNGKFMVNQKVLRGASCATPEGHSRPSYRNFFHPHLRWQFTGIRLAK